MNAEGTREFRVTINSFYTDDCPGKTNLSARNGHYVWAETPIKALLDTFARLSKSHSVKSIDDLTLQEKIDGSYKKVEFPK